MNNPKKIIIVLLPAVLLLAGLGLLWLGGNRGGGAEQALATGVSSGGFSSVLPAYDFGSISMARGKVQHDFVLSNDGASPITVTKAFTSCMCTTAKLLLSGGESLGPFGMPGHAPLPSLSAKVMPRESVTIRTIFDPAAHGPAGIGMVERQVVLERADGNQSVVKFRATVTP